MSYDYGEIIIRRFFKEHSLAQNLINSFNEFVDVTMQKIVNEIGKIEPEILPPGVESFEIRLGKIRVEKPMIVEPTGAITKITPMEARLRDLTYEGPIYLEAIPVKNGIEGEPEIVYIGSLPIMLRSKYCYLHGKSEEELIEMGEDPNDPGGYFIINGTEKAVVMVEDLMPNSVFVEKEKLSPYPWVAKIFSERGEYRVPHLLEKSKDGIVFVTFGILKRIPFVVLMKALGIEQDQKIFEMVDPPEEITPELYYNLVQYGDVKTREEALDFIGKTIGIPIEEKRKARARDYITRFFLPHIGNTEKENILKAYYLAKAVRKLMMHSHGMIPPDDKDFYGNKKLRAVGELFEMLFRYAFNYLVDDMKYNFEKIAKRKRFPSVQAITRPKQFTKKIQTALATGQWVGDRTGVAQLVERHNYIRASSYLRKVVSPVEARGEAMEVRQLHTSHWGRLCAVQTPESTEIGLRKFLAILSEVSTGVNEKDVLKEISNFGINLYDESILGEE